MLVPAVVSLLIVLLLSAVLRAEKKGQARLSGPIRKRKRFVRSPVDVSRAETFPAADGQSEILSYPEPNPRFLDDDSDSDDR